MTTAAEPIPGVRVEIWQCDVNGRYIHHRDRDDDNDLDFQGFGYAVTDSGGRYRFRTIRPVPYTGRTPHIHVKVMDPRGTALLTTQMYVAAEPGNEQDGLYTSMSVAQKRSVTVELGKNDSGEFTAEFPIVV